MRTANIGALLAAVAILGCGGGDGPTGNNGGNNGGINTCTSTSNAVQVLDNRYSPTCTTVPVGTTVDWTWGNVVNPHTVTFSATETSPSQTSGTYSRLFGAAGTFNYTCTVHGAAMSGRVVVQ